MDISNINYLAVLVAAIAGFAWGAIWYMALSRPWMAAARIDPSQGSRSMQPFIVSFIALLVMALILSVMIANVGMGEFTLQAGLMMGFVAWLGFILTTLAVNQRYQGYGWGLTVIDALHWLGVALIMGAILGWWGIPMVEEVPAA